MNKVILMGRITKDIETKTTQSQKSVCGFTIAVDRKYKGANGEKQSDFISCVAWGKNADFAAKYLRKGSKIAITGEIQTRDYLATDGKKVYVTEINVEEFDFCESKKTDDDTPPFDM